MAVGPARNPTRRWSSAAALPCLAAFAFAQPGTAESADVYASRASDGSVRYASWPLDASYRLILQETPPRQQAPRPPGRRAAALQPLIERIAAQHGVAAELVDAIVAVESGYDAAAVSPKGARGPMQLMPSTARRYGVSSPAHLNDAEKNIDAGVRHLKDLLVQYEGNVALALAAYNAGGGAVQRHGSRIPPYRETMLYVPSVMARSAAAAAR